MRSELIRISAVLEALLPELYARIPVYCLRQLAEDPDIPAWMVQCVHAALDYSVDWPVTTKRTAPGRGKDRG